MNKLSKPLLAGVLIVSSLGLVSMASAMPFDEGAGCWRGGHQMGAGHKHGGQGFNIERMANKLDLTDDQSARIGSILEESRQQMGDLHDKTQVNREQVRELIQQSPLNEAAIRTVADTQGDVKADMIVLRAQQHAKINSILTDDQRTQLKEMRGKRHRDR